MQSWPVNIFIQDIIDNGCIWLEHHNDDGEKIDWYLSARGKRKVQINITDEEITTTTIQEYLWLLELADLIDRKYNHQDS